MTLTSSEYRKPRVALMGEFSAGKSTLSNLLLGQRVLPEKVTATRLPPVWMTSGNDAPMRMTIAGETFPVDLARLEDVPLEETLYIKLCLDAEVLDHCDLIDFPGISDPNMSSQIWERLLGRVDAVLWCTHATQAWRQSEASAWGLIPEQVRANSLLLITRFDKLTNERDKERVLKRVTRETAGQFADVCPISLTEALAAGQDDMLFKASGAQDFLLALSGIIGALASLPKETESEMDYAVLPAMAGEALSLVDSIAARNDAEAESSALGFDRPESGQSPGGEPNHVLVAPGHVAPPRVHSRPLPREDRPAPMPAGFAESAGNATELSAGFTAPPRVHSRPLPREERPASIPTGLDESAGNTAEPTSGYVMPRRVVASGNARTARPSRPDPVAVVRDPVFDQKSAVNRSGDLDQLRDALRQRS